MSCLLYADVAEKMWINNNPDEIAGVYVYIHTIQVVILVCYLLRSRGYPTTGQLRETAGTLQESGMLVSTDHSSALL